MNHAVFTPIAARQPPSNQVGLLPWLRSRFFDGWANSLLTVLVLALLAWALPPLLNWTVFNAVVQADNAACRSAQPATSPRTAASPIAMCFMFIPAAIAPGRSAWHRRRAWPAGLADRKWGTGIYLVQSWIVPRD